MKFAPDIDCYSTEHLKWSLLIGVPMMIVWVFGCPILAFVILFRNRKRLNESEFEKYFIILYQGLKDKYFYWEIVNIIRKVLVVAINVFFSRYPIFYKGASAIIFMIFLARVQIRLQPFKLRANNECELLSFSASIVTLFAGLMYASDTPRVAIIDL